MTRQKGNRTGGREVTDGHHLHNEIIAHADYHLTYDNGLEYLKGMNNVRYSTRSVFGRFECLQCLRPKPWAWNSGKICVQIWFSRNPDRYMTRIHSQKCRRCESYAEPQLDTDSYATKLVDAFDLWKGLRDRRKPGDDFRPTPPHDTYRCHGCLQEQRLQHRWIHFTASSAAKPGSESSQRNNCRSRGPPAREEVEGDHLHDALLQHADYELTYDHSLIKSTMVRYSTRSIVGKFVCRTCTTRSPMMWESGVVCIELWFHLGTNRYRTLLHSQKCKRCNQYAEPDVNLGNYIHK
ncbi:hypothetical protein BGZ92_004410, partial [Podila epicladia]